MRGCPPAGLPGTRFTAPIRGCVLAVARRHQVTTGVRTCRADQLARLPRSAWQRRSAGQGAKGHRYYDWGWISIEPSQPGHHWLLIRRNRRTKDLAFYHCRQAIPGHGQLLF
jgi:hypothetical protein